MKSEFVQRALLGFVLASILATDVYSAPSLEPLDIGSVAAMNLDRRLYAIAHDPSLMTKLDQRKCFRNTEAYDARLAASVAVARRVLPELISVTNLQKAVTAMCLADGRVYFWLSLDDRILLGWIPMVLKNGDAEKKLVLWLVPKKNEASNLSNLWQRHNPIQENAIWFSDIVKEGFGITLAGGVQTNKTVIAFQGRTLVATSIDTMWCAVETKIAERVVQIEIILSSKTDSLAQSVFIDADLNYDIDSALPFWPPEEPGKGQVFCPVVQQGTGALKSSNSP